MKLQLGRKYKIATLNIRGTKKPGVRDEVEKWMIKHNIMILGLTETRGNQNTRETRKQYTWFFSGEGGRSEYTAGVAIVIQNKFIQYVDDIEPIDYRLIPLTLRGTIETTIAITYMPPADRPQEEKQKAYDNLQYTIDKGKNKGPMYILGDFNSRLIYPITGEEELIMGKHTLHNNADTLELETFTDDMKDNRDLLTTLCTQNELRVLNTMYRKQPHKTATYRKIKTKPIEGEIEIISAEKHEQLDYIITTRRWRNTVSDAESDTRANIKTDHFPVIATIKTKLKGKTTQGKGRDRYEPCTQEQKEHLNKRLRTDIEMDEPCAESLKKWIGEGQKELPKMTPRDRYRKHQMSNKSKQLIEERGRAIKERNLAKFDNLSREFRKSRKQDRKDRVIEGLSKDLDLRERWLGIRELKSKYNPNPYHNKDKQGNHIQWKDRAEKAAEHLSTQQWGLPETTNEPQREWNEEIFVQYTEEETFNIDPPTME